MEVIWKPSLTCPYPKPQTELKVRKVISAKGKRDNYSLLWYTASATMIPLNPWHTPKGRRIISTLDETNERLNDLPKGTQLLHKWWSQDSSPSLPVCKAWPFYQSKVFCDYTWLCPLIPKSQEVRELETAELVWPGQSVTRTQRINSLFAEVMAVFSMT